MASKALPRGIRNNNPGNIEKGAPWQGLAPDQSADSRFCVFIEPEWGIRAIIRVLITYYDKHGLDTVEGIINRWAPPVENDTGSYARAVAHKLHATPLDRVDIYDPTVMMTLTRAIVRHENGVGPMPEGEWYEDHIYNRAMELAGIEIPLKPIVKSRTMAGAATAATATIPIIYEALPDIASQASTVAAYAPTNWVNIAFVIVVLAGLAYIVYARIDDRKKKHK